MFGDGGGPALDAQNRVLGVSPRGSRLRVSGLHQRVRLARLDHERGQNQVTNTGFVVPDWADMFQ